MQDFDKVGGRNSRLRSRRNDVEEDGRMNQVTCECGFATRAPQEDQVVRDVLTHVRADHPDLVGDVSPDVVRGWIEVVPD
jgi:predicted small metal-binding protein